MRWVYRLQQRIAITQGECTVLFVLAFLLALGLGARHLQRQAQPLPDAGYAEAEELFQEASALPPAETTGEGLPAPAADSTAASPTPRRSRYGAKPAPPSAPINLNTASSAALQRLPRIGPKMAARIIAYREAHGAFRRVQDLVQVRGIGKKTLEQLSPYLFVAPEEHNEP